MHAVRLYSGREAHIRTNEQHPLSADTELFELFSDFQPIRRAKMPKNNTQTPVGDGRKAAQSLDWVWSAGRIGQDQQRR